MGIGWECNARPGTLLEVPSQPEHELRTRQPQHDPVALARRCATSSATSTVRRRKGGCRHGPERSRALTPSDRGVHGVHGVHGRECGCVWGNVHGQGRGGTQATSAGGGAERSDGAGGCRRVGGGVSWVDLGRAPAVGVRFASLLAQSTARVFAGVPQPALWDGRGGVLQGA